MAITQVTNNDEHNAAIKRVEELWNSEPGTPEHEELGKLGKLISDYEDKVFPF